MCPPSLKYRIANDVLFVVGAIHWMVPSGIGVELGLEAGHRAHRGVDAIAGDDKVALDLAPAVGPLDHHADDPAILGTDQVDHGMGVFDRQVTREQVQDRAHVDGDCDGAAVLARGDVPARLPDLVQHTQFLERRKPLVSQHVPPGHELPLGHPLKHEGLEPAQPKQPRQHQPHHPATRNCDLHGGKVSQHGHVLVCPCRRGRLQRSEPCPDSSASPTRTAPTMR